MHIGMNVMIKCTRIHICTMYVAHDKRFIKQIFVLGSQHISANTLRFHTVIPSFRNSMINSALAKYIKNNYIVVIRQLYRGCQFVKIRVGK